MQESDKKKIIDMLIGNYTINNFESWIYSDINLENRIDKELYFELIDINYKDKSVLEKLKKIILDNYISIDEVEDVIYENKLLNIGWTPNRQIKVKLPTLNNTEILNAFYIIQEFGGLKFKKTEGNESETFVFFEFLTEPLADYNMSEFSLNKNLVQFATAHNDHIDIFVDEDNKFYYLDSVVSEYLYEFSGQNLNKMVQQFLKPDYETYFNKLKQNNS